MTSTYEFEDIESKYKNFFAPSFKAYASGTDLVNSGAAITSVNVETRLDGADTASLSICNAYDPAQNTIKFVDGILALGNSLVITMGYADSQEYVFTGIISAITYDFPAEGVPVINVTGIDKSFFLQKGKKSFSWTKKKDSEAVTDIAGQYSINTSIDATSVVKEVIEQRTESDYEFINRLAAEDHYEFFVAGNTLYFRKPHQSSNMDPVVTLKYGRNLRSFNKEINIASQVGDVVVRGWDYTQKQAVQGTAAVISKLTSSRSSGTDIIKRLVSSSTEYIYDPNVDTAEKAVDRATSEANKIAMKLMTGSGESIGIPEIRAGRYIYLDGLSKSVSQLYYIVNAKHRINSSGYITTFSLGGNVI